MNIKNIFRLSKNSGVALVEMVVVVGILGFLALAVSTTFSDIFKMQAKVISRNEANEFGAGLARFIYAESTCTEALKGKTFPVDSARQITLPNYVGFAGGSAGAGTALSKNQEIIPNKIRISKLELSDKKMPVQSLIFNSFPVKRYLAQLVVGTQTRVGNTPGGAKKWVDNPPRRFEFPVLVRADNGRILKCMIGSSLADACQAIGSVLDTTTGKCKPVNQCFFKGHYTTNVCTGGSSCPPNIINPVTKTASCPAASSANQVGPYTWDYPDSCGKKCTTTVVVTTNVYLCLKCN